MRHRTWRLSWALGYLALLALVIVVEHPPKFRKDVECGGYEESSSNLAPAGYQNCSAELVPMAVPSAQ